MKGKLDILYKGTSPIFFDDALDQINVCFVDDILNMNKAVLSKLFGQRVC